MTIELPTTAPTAESVLAEITRVIEEILDEYDIEDIEVTRETQFQEDLELESIDLVTLGGKLREIYGERIRERGIAAIAVLHIGFQFRQVQGDQPRDIRVVFDDEDARLAVVLSDRMHGAPRFQAKYFL